MERQAAVVLYVLAMVAVVVGVGRPVLQAPFLAAADRKRRNCPGVRGVLFEVPEASMSAGRRNAGHRASQRTQINGRRAAKRRHVSGWLSFGPRWTSSWRDSEFHPEIPLSERGIASDYAADRVCICPIRDRPVGKEAVISRKRGRSLCGAGAGPDRGRMAGRHPPRWTIRNRRRWPP